jgi:hypothetical protein
MYSYEGINRRYSPNPHNGGYLSPSSQLPIGEDQGRDESKLN